MAGKLPIDRVREARDAPKVYDEHRERFTSHQAGLREADDPVSGGRPEAPPDELAAPEGPPMQGGESGLDPDASLTDRVAGVEPEGPAHPAEPEDPDGP